MTQHNHTYQIIKDTAEAIVEYCTQCKKKLITKKDLRTGRIDNKTYLKEHAVDFAQPHGRTKKIYEKHYGKYVNKQEEIEKVKKEQKEHAQEKYEKEMQAIKRQEMSGGKLYYQT